MGSSVSRYGSGREIRITLRQAYRRYDFVALTRPNRIFGGALCRGGATAPRRGRGFERGANYSPGTLIAPHSHFAERRKPVTFKLSRETLNLILASAAVLISAASFYATYLQSLAAQAQVRAATLPYFEVSHGNVDDTDQSARVYFIMRNVGGGPLILKSFTLSLNGRRLRDLEGLLKECCSSILDDLPKDAQVKAIGRTLTDTAAPRVIPAGDRVLIFSIDKSEDNTEVFNALDRVRWGLSTQACYCAITGDCWQARGAEIAPVEICQPDDEAAYWR